MATQNLTADVYADSANGSYRLYIDSDLITERTWIWPVNQIFIREHIIAELQPGKHSVLVETCDGTADFQIRSLTVNGIPVETTDLTFDINLA